MYNDNMHYDSKENANRQNPLSRMTISTMTNDNLHKNTPSIIEINTLTLSRMKVRIMTVSRMKISMMTLRMTIRALHIMT